MKLKMLTSMAGMRLSVRPGDIADFPAPEAKRLIEAGYAEAIDNVADAKVAKAVDEALAKAAVQADADKVAAVDQAVADLKAKAEADIADAVAKAIEEVKAQAETEKAEAVAAALAKPEQGAGA